MVGVADSAGRPGGRDDRLLAWPAVRDITGLSRTTAWRLQKTGDFPLPVVVSPGRVGWWESELAAWKISRAPRRPAEMRPFGRSARPASIPIPEERAGCAVGGSDPAEPSDRRTNTEAGPDAGPQRPSRRRSAPTASEQIAFDFGL